MRVTRFGGDLAAHVAQSLRDWRNSGARRASLPSSEGKGQPGLTAKLWGCWEGQAALGTHKAPVPDIKNFPNMDKELNNNNLNAFNAPRLSSLFLASLPLP